MSVENHIQTGCEKCQDESYTGLSGGDLLAMHLNFIVGCQAFTSHGEGYPPGYIDHNSMNLVETLEDAAKVLLFAEILHIDNDNGY